MTDREKVIDGIAKCSCNLCEMDCYECPYYTEVKGVHCYQELLRDALALLKEQEAVAPNVENDGEPDEHGTWWYVCGACGNAVDPCDEFCRKCGRQVKWNG